MPRDIGLDTLDELLAANAQLVEVLPAGEYLEEHLPGAINLSLRELSPEVVKSLDAARPWSSTAGTPFET